MVASSIVCRLLWQWVSERTCYTARGPSYHQVGPNNTCGDAREYQCQLLYVKLCRRTAYLIANAAVVTNIILFLYTGIYLAKLKGISDAETNVPWVVPAGAASLAAAVLMYTVSLWPVFSMLSPVIVFVMAFGCMMSLSLLPNFGLLSVSSTSTKRD
jgi:hypothetical protein